MFCRFWGESACACNFTLRNSGSSENSCVLRILRCIYMFVQLSSQKQQTYELSRENPYPRGWSSEKQLCSVDFEVYLRARATFFSETADLVKTAVFWRFWGVSTCSCNFLLRNCRLTNSRGRIPVWEDDLVKKQLCSVDFEVNLRARATFFSETADLVKTAVFWQFLRCARATFFSETADLRVLEGESLSERMI